MDAREFAEWIAYCDIEPFGGTREDQRAGIIAAAIVNQYRKPGSALDWTDFLPLYETRNPPEDWRDLLRRVELINQMLGGEDRRTERAAPDD